jgi:hypothetical protein
VTIDEDLRRALGALRAQHGQSGWPDPVGRIEAGIHRRRRRRRITLAVGVLALAGLAAQVALMAAGWPSGDGEPIALGSTERWAPVRNPYALVVAGLVAVAGLWFARRAVSSETVERFRQRYGVAPPVGATLVAYLATRRRWRVFGVTVALIVELLHSTTERIDVRFAVVAGGLLTGALVGEWRFRVLTAATHGPRQRVPRLLTVALTGVLVLVVGAHLGIPRLGEVTPGDVRVWGAVAAVVAITTGTAIHTLTSWRSPRGKPDESTAIAMSGMHSVAAFGVATAILCLVQALAIAHDHLLGTASAAAVGDVAPTLAVAAGVVSVILAYGGRHRHDATRWSDPRVQVAVVSVVALSLSAGLLAYRLVGGRPPFDAAAVDPRVTVLVAEDFHYEAAAAALGTIGEQPEILAPGSLVYGRLDIDTPSGVGGQYHYWVVVIDEVTNTAAQAFGTDGSGWGHPLYLVPRQYPWLSALAGSQGASAFQRSDRPGPILFTAFFEPGVTVSVDRLLVALILVGPGDRINWAAQVPVTALTLPT